MRRLLLLVLLGAACVLVGAPAAVAFPGGPWSRPVAGPVVRGFDPPATRFGPGHLGVDFGVPPGTPVRAAGDGVVVFAGRVGAGLHVVVLHAGDVRTTDSFLAAIAVVRGARVTRGEVLGTSGGTGPQHAAGVLHFGVRVGDEYIDPMLLFAPPDLGRIVHLAEPHGGSFGGPAAPSFTAPTSASEIGALGSVLRVDARPPVRPPPWWPTAAPPRRAAPDRQPPPPVQQPPSRPDRHPAAPIVPIAAGAAGSGGVLVLRRRQGRAYR